MKQIYFYIGLALISIVLWILPVGDHKEAIQGKTIKGEGIDTICPKCGETGCIYFEIDNIPGNDGTDKAVYDAILKVSERRHLTDGQVDTLFNEYKL